MAISLGPEPEPWEAGMPLGSAECEGCDLILDARDSIRDGRAFFTHTSRGPYYIESQVTHHYIYACGKEKCIEIAKREAETIRAGLGAEEL